MKIAEGQHVRLARDVKRFPSFIAEAGMTGRVVWVDTREGRLTDVAIRMDENIPGAAEWDNEIHWDEFIIGELPGDVEVIA